MTGDVKGGISNIDWSVYGKILSINKKDNNNIAYTYDPAGNRVSKNANGIKTYYVRDAQGNNLAVYDNQGGTINWQEQTLYGSSRLGMWRPNINLADADGTSQWGTYGKKFFELSNHLGNGLSVISDNRDFSGSEFLPVAVSGNDYYAFGGQMPGLGFNSSNYRYGFNGKENDNEVKGAGNQQDYGMRIYDPRIAKFLSVDPISAEYPFYTPYQFAGNTPIQAVDLDGAEPLYVIDSKSNLFDYTTAEKRNAAKEVLVGVVTATDVNDVTVLTTMFTRRGKAINFDGKPAGSWDKGFAIGGAIIPFVSGSLLKQSAKWGARSAEWLYHASKGAKVADAILDNSALRKALGTAIKAGEEAHHIIPVQLLKEEKVVQDAVNAGFDFNGSVNGIAVKKYTKAVAAAVDGGVHANHPNYTKQVLNNITEWADKAKANGTCSPDNARKFLENFSNKLKKTISENKATKVNDLKFNEK